MKFKARVHTSLKKSVLNPQWQTTLRVLAVFDKTKLVSCHDLGAISFAMERR